MADFAVQAVHGSNTGATVARISAANANSAALRAVVDGLIGTSWNEGQHGEPYLSHTGVGYFGRIRVTVAWGHSSTAGAIQLEVEPIR
jgi:hypothetical protein